MASTNNECHSCNIHAGSEGGLKIRRGWVSDNQGILKKKILLLFCQNQGVPSGLFGPLAPLASWPFWSPCPLDSDGPVMQTHERRNMMCDEQWS